MIVITGPTGNIGSQVLFNILDRSEKIRVIARDPSKLSAEARQRAEVIEGSHRDLDVVMKAFEGADAVFWLMVSDINAPSADVAYVDFSRPGCQAMKACGVKRVVGVSALGRGWPKDAGYVTASLKLDDMIAATGVSYRALACGSLMENNLRQIASIRDRGVFTAPSHGDRKVAAVATRDIATVASRLLLDPSWNGVESIPLMGPEDVSFDDMVRIMSDVLVMPIVFEEISMDAIRAMMKSRGATEGMTQAIVNLLIAGNEGINHLIPRTNASDTPTNFRQWCELVLKPAVLAN